MKDYINGLDENIVSFIENHNIEEIELFEVTRKYAEILINAVPYRDGDKVSGVFPFDVIDAFADQFKALFNSKLPCKEDKEELFQIVNDTYKNTISNDEMSAMPSGFVPVEDYHKKSMGHCGTFYSCNYIPEDVVNHIKEKAIVE